jgi:hypothetical protein
VRQIDRMTRAIAKKREVLETLRTMQSTVSRLPADFEAIVARYAPALSSLAVGDAVGAAAHAVVEARRVALGDDATVRLLTVPDDVALDAVLISRGETHRILLMTPMHGTRIDYTSLRPEELCARSAEDADMQWLEVEAKPFVDRVRKQAEATAKANREYADVWQHLAKVVGAN